MIRIKSKADCCGCWACAQKCPKQCIKMEEDSEGFLYPKIDIHQCIDCGLCNRICPVINQTESTDCPLSCYAAYCQDEIIRKESSSGGIFTLLAEMIISQGGIVCGAIFNSQWEVVHTIIESKEDLAQLRGSKYVQSKIGGIFTDVERLLKQNKRVLFTGSPCQIAGLHKLLRKDYTNLSTVDFICHGVPSPGVWRRYLNEIQFLPKTIAKNRYIQKSQSLMPLIKEIRFRDKSDGWKNYRFVLTFVEPSNKGEYETISISQGRFENEYMNSFLKNYNLRPSCYKCPSKSGRSGSDITICDFWGIENEIENMNDDKGVSGIIINTKKGQHLFDLIKSKCYHQSVEIDRLIAHNKSYNNNCNEPIYRKYFFRRFAKKKEMVRDLLIPNKTTSFYMFMERIIKKIIKATK